jgi:hypothetical protein
MDLAPIRIEYTDRDGARWPINVGHKGDGARDASCVGAPFPKDAGRPVEELDAKLHGSESSTFSAGFASRRSRLGQPTSRSLSE